MTILNFVSCNLDYVYSMDHIVVPGETQASEEMEVFAGGKGLNQSVALARAGAEVFHGGCIGEDGEMLRTLLADSGVNVSLLRQIDGKNGHAIIQVAADGQNSILLYAGSNRCITKEQMDEALSLFSEGDMLLLQNEINDISYLIDRAYERGIRIFLNPSPCDESLRAISFEKLSCIVLNEIEAKFFTGKEHPTEHLAFFRERYPHLTVMLTLGGDGCVYSDGYQTVSHPIFPVTAVDTTAAGDTFTGYFMAALAEGREPAEAIRLASAAAALAVSVKGAAPSIPLRKQVENMLANAE
ncbi:MAG: ribokinase [Clostridia bacterium]|nr:ribokinase [Clostridia bacterium]